MSDLDEIFTIVFLAGDKSCLSIVGVETCVAYEINDYMLASCHRFYDRGEVVQYAQNLALKNNLSLSSSDEQIRELFNGNEEIF